MIVVLKAHPIKDGRTAIYDPALHRWLCTKHGQTTWTHLPVHAQSYVSSKTVRAAVKRIGATVDFNPPVAKGA